MLYSWPWTMKLTWGGGAFSYQHPSEQQRLVEHIDVVVRSHHPKESMPNPEVIRCNCLKHDGRISDVSPGKLAPPTHRAVPPLPCMQSRLPNILGNPCSSPFANRR